MGGLPLNLYTQLISDEYFREAVNPSGHPPKRNHDDTAPNGPSSKPLHATGGPPSAHLPRPRPAHSNSTSLAPKRMRVRVPRELFPPGLGEERLAQFPPSQQVRQQRSLVPVAVLAPAPVH